MESDSELRDAARQRSVLVKDIRVPRGYDEALGLSVASTIIAVAVFVTVDAWWATAWFALALVLHAVVGVVLVRRFRRANGVWVNGFRGGGTTLRATSIASISHVGAMICAIAAADRGLWWLVIVLAAGAGLVQIWASRDWMRRYHVEQSGT